MMSRFLTTGLVVVFTFVLHAVIVIGPPTNDDSAIMAPLLGPLPQEGGVSVKHTSQLPGGAVVFNHIYNIQVGGGESDLCTPVTAPVQEMNEAMNTMESDGYTVVFNHTLPAGVNIACPTWDQVRRLQALLEELEDRVEILEAVVTDVSGQDLIHTPGRPRNRPIPNSRQPTGTRFENPKDCKEVRANGHVVSGIYTIWPSDNLTYGVYCDMVTEGGGWIVIQKRYDGSVNFYRDWADYKSGFGDLNGEFWLGNERINSLTNGDPVELRVDLWADTGDKVYAEYSTFRLLDEQLKYKIDIAGYSGTAGDSLIHHSGAPFSTRDRDNDINIGSCAAAYKGAWWYVSCYRSNLNAMFNDNEGHSPEGSNWVHWTAYDHDIRRTEMKIRAIDP